MTMENFDELIFDDEEFLDDESQIVEEVKNEPIEQSDDLTSEVLRLKGISDPTKIKFEDETGAVIERSWDSLTREEQLNILSNDTSEETQLDDDEIELLNTIRSSGMTVNDFMNNLVNSNSKTPEPKYQIDELSDDDLYLLDILEKVGAHNISDEELTEALNAAKANEKLFQKTVEGLRNQYIQLEKDKKMKEANDLALKQQESYNQFASAIFNEIRGLNSFAGQDLELSDEDVEELSAFMLDIDNNGLSPFGKAMQDPALFTRAAFWLLNEDKIIEELTKQMQDTYTRGYENAKKDMQSKSKLVISQPTKNNNNFDNFVEDDEWY